jgi:hypothetical protein
MKSPGSIAQTYPVDLNGTTEFPNTGILRSSLRLCLFASLRLCAKTFQANKLLSSEPRMSGGLSRKDAKGAKTQRKPASVPLH